VDFIANGCVNRSQQLRESFLQHTKQITDIFVNSTRQHSLEDNPLRDASQIPAEISMITASKDGTVCIYDSREKRKVSTIACSPGEYAEKIILTRDGKNLIMLLNR
jgi:WD40 repeat protein